MALTILITGFGPFPGAPFNPTEALVKRLARLRRPALAEVKIVPHVFPTRYAAVDRDLPRLIARHKPDALLMFGLATRAKTLRVETRARNALTLLADAGGSAPRNHIIAAGAPPAMQMPAPTRRLLAAIRATGVPAVLSCDAGRYLCNYLCWRATEAAAKSGPRLAAFIHVPPIRRGSGGVKRLTLDDLARAGGRALAALAAAARR
ncbi:MAG: pyroglutamyl-peptidase I [Rhizobiales bacterium]|nr:pyroglutamyl-peptidase I [Hyphomicrobiales bacterium]